MKTEKHGIDLDLEVGKMKPRIKRKIMINAWKPKVNGCIHFKFKKSQKAETEEMGSQKEVGRRQISEIKAKYWKR